MRTLRFCFLLSSLSLLGACAGSVSTTGTPCPHAGMPSAAHQSCWYWLKVTEIDAERNWVTGIDLRNKSSKFRVRDIEMLVRTNQLNVNNEYLFSGVSNSPYLELYPEKAVPDDLIQKAKKVID